MTEWSQIHTDVHIGGADGFSFVLIRKPDPVFLTTVLSEEEQEFVSICLPGRKPRVINGVERPYEPWQALRMYMCESMSDTFAIGQTQRDYKTYFIIGTRSPRDLFKLNLKFPETTNTKTWDANILFYIRTAKDDVFSDNGTASFGHRRVRSEEGW